MMKAEDQRGIIEKFRLYHRLFGWRALLFAPVTRLRRCPTEVTVVPPALRHPVHLRLKTSDVGVYKQIFFDDEYALAVRKPPAVIIDAGANIGFAAVYFATKYPQARVLAIEPEAANFALLQKNVAPYPNVIPIRAALWGANTTIDLMDFGDGPWGFQTRPANPSDLPRVLAQVQAFTLDRIMADHGVTFIDVLKIDIEGSEKAVFQNAAAWIEKIGVIMIELHDQLQAGCSQVFAQATKAFTFRHQRGETIFVARTDYAPAPLPNEHSAHG